MKFNIVGMTNMQLALLHTYILTLSTRQIFFHKIKNVGHIFYTLCMSFWISFDNDPIPKTVDDLRETIILTKNRHMNTWPDDKFTSKFPRICFV